MNNYLLFISLIGSLFISGCTSTPTWQKQGMSHYETQNTFAKCRYDMGLAKVNPNDKLDLLSECMLSNGYRLH